MKKLIRLALLAAGAAYILTKKKEKEEVVDEEITIVKLDDCDEIIEEESSQQEEDDVLNATNAYYNIKYPHLKHGFIVETLQYASNFNVDYPDGTELTLAHIVKFEHVEMLIEFVKMVKENDYFIQEGDEENSIYASKDFVTKNENILEEILHIANQVACIGGEYSGFQIDRK